MASYTRVGLFVWAVQMLAIAATRGTIGYGINMYHPWCCTPCHDAVSSLYLDCTTFSESTDHGGMVMKLSKRMDMGMEMMGDTSNECYASNLPYLQTLSYCIKSHCDADDVSYDKQNECYQTIAAGGLSVSSLHDSLPTGAPSKELATDDMWLNETMLVNEVYYRADRDTRSEFETTEHDHVTFSIIIMTVSIGISIIGGLWVFGLSQLSMESRKSWLVSKFQSHILLPTAYGSRHLHPLPWKIGYVPKRSMSIFLAIYITLNVIFCAMPYRSVQQSIWFSSQTQEIGIYIANRTGVLSFANIALTMLFSGRNNPLMYISGWSQATYLTLHRWTSRMAVVQAIVHSIIYTIDYCDWTGVDPAQNSAYTMEAALPYFWWGIIATTALGLMAGVSVLPMRKSAYDLFLILHIGLAILALIGSWYHVVLRFEKRWGYEVWLYIAFAFWSYDRLVRTVKVFYYNILERTSAQVEKIPGTNVVVMTLYPGKSWTPRPGQHTFLYFFGLGKFWENHPFTIANWGYKPKNTLMVNDQAGFEETSPQSTQSCSTREKHLIVKETVATSTNDACAPKSESDLSRSRFYVQHIFRIHKGATSKLYKSLSTTEHYSNISVATEGPYGGHSRGPSLQPLKQAENILCIAGGIGITFSVGFAKQFAQERSGAADQFRSHSLMPKCQKFTLAWSVREQPLCDYVKQHCLPDVESSTGLDDGSLRYRIWLTGHDEGTKPQSLSSSSASMTSNRKHITTTSSMPIHSKNDHQAPSILQYKGRMNVNKVLNDFLDIEKRNVVLVCGPGILSDEVRNEVVAHSKRGFVVDLIEESFSW